MFPHFAEKIMFGSVYPGGKIAAFYTPFIYSYPLSMSNSRKALLRLVGLSTSTDKAAYCRYHPAIVAGGYLLS